MAASPHSFTALLATSGENHGVPRLASVLHAAGCHVTLFCRHGLVSSRTRYADAHVRAPGALGLLIDALRGHLAHARYDWVVIGDDTMMGALAAQAPARWLEGWFSVDPRGPLPALVMSKVAFARAMHSVGIPAPRFAVAATLDEARRAAAGLGFPVMLKRDRSCAGAGVARADGDSDVARAFAAVSDGMPLLIQEFLPFEVGVVEALFDHGRPACWAASLKCRSWPAPYGPSSARRFINRIDAWPILSAIGGITHQHGFGGFDFILDPRTDALRVIELHARATSGIALATRLGAPFPRAIASMLRGEKGTFAPDFGIDGAKTVPMFPQEAVAAIQRRRLHETARLLFDSRDVPFDDPPLLRAQLRMLAQSLWRSAMGRGLKPADAKTATLPAAPRCKAA